MLVKILSTVETSCTTYAHYVAVMELQGYSWSTCSKQPRLGHCCPGVVNKLDRRRWRLRDLLTTRSTCRGEMVSIGGKYPNFWRYPNFLITQCGLGGRKPPCQNKLDSSSRFDTVPACDRQMDRRTDRRIHDDSIYRANIALRGEISVFTARCYASAVRAIALCLSVCPSQVKVLLRWMNELSWFLACELPSTHPTLC